MEKIINCQFKLAEEFENLIGQCIVIECKLGIFSLLLIGCALMLYTAWYIRNRENICIKNSTHQVRTKMEGGNPAVGDPKGENSFILGRSQVCIFIKHEFFLIFVCMPNTRTLWPQMKMSCCKFWIYRGGCKYKIYNVYDKRLPILYFYICISPANIGGLTLSAPSYQKLHIAPAPSNFSIIASF